MGILKTSDIFDKTVETLLVFTIFGTKAHFCQNPLPSVVMETKPGELQTPKNNMGWGERGITCF